AGSIARPAAVPLCTTIGRGQATALPHNCELPAGHPDTAPIHQCAATHAALDNFAVFIPHASPAMMLQPSLLGTTLALCSTIGTRCRHIEVCSPVQERSEALEAAHTAEGLARRLVMRLGNLSAGVAIASLLLFQAWPTPAQQPLKTAVDGTFAPHA